MKKKALALLMATTMVASALAGCGNSETPETPATSGDNTPAATQESQKEEEKPQEQAVDFGSGEIKIWVADKVVDTTKALTDEFFAAHPEMSGYTVVIEEVGEGDSAGKIITDVEAAPDIYGFAQDQLTRLVAAGAIATIGGDYAEFVKTANDAGAAAAAMVGDQVYAFPYTSDNGYFLYYDKSVVTDPSTLEAIIADCEAAGKNFYFDTAAWWQTAFFFGNGCQLTFDTDSEGNFTACNMDYASDKGVKALKAIVNMSSSKSYQKGSSVGTAVNWAAIVDGVWDSTSAKEVLGDNYACAKLPTVTVDGETFQLGGFGGFKLMGVKPQAEVGKLAVCLELAKYLTDTKAQLDRFNVVGWGPSNLEAQKNEAVQADEALSALAEQLAFAVPQGQYPGDYWSEGDALGESATNGSFAGYTDEQLMAELQAFTDKMMNIVK